MTQLFIDGKEAVLPSDLSVELHVCNPLLTEEGAVTYDIDLDLRVPANARLYGHADRLNSTSRPSGRGALLMCDGRTVVRGTEVFLKLDGYHAKIQIVGGNSEMNYNAAELKMHDLDLGKIEPAGGVITEAYAAATLQTSYPDSDVVFTPVCTTYEPDGIEKIWPYAPYFLNEVYFSPDAEADTQTYVDDTTLVPQPYLLAILRRVIEALGYKVALNTLESDERNRRLYIVNTEETLEFAKMVPNWTVSKFLEEVQKFFDCFLRVNIEKKTVDIIQSYTYYSASNEEYLDARDVVDEYEQEFDIKNGVDKRLYDGVGYNFPNTELYRYWDVPAEIMSKVTVSQEGEYLDFEESLFDSGKDLYNRLSAYELNGFPSPHVVIKGLCGNATQYYPRLFNTMQTVPSGDKSSVVSLNIVPAEVFVLGMLARFNLPSQSYDKAVYAFSAIPYGRTVDSPTTSAESAPSQQEEEEQADVRPDGTTEEEGFNEYIINGKLPAEKATLEQLPVAFYMGMEYVKFPPIDYPSTHRLNNPKFRPPFPENTDDCQKYPTSVVFPYASVYITDYVERGSGDHSSADIWLPYPYTIKMAPDEYDLSPSYRKEHYYSNPLHYDTTQEYTIRFRSSALLDPTKVFVIKNRSFYCKELTYRVEADGLNKMVEGVFYAIDHGDE